MPELPEVETMRRGILPIVGATIESAERTPCKCRPISITPRIDRLNRRLAGQTIAAVERLGKRVVIRTDGEDRLILEPRMAGLVLIDAPPTREHLRFRLRLSGGSVGEVLFWDRRGLGQITLMDRNEYDARLNSGQLGPDALEITIDEFRLRLARTSRPVKVALLDQSILAGVGNLYASELLHQARVSPLRPCEALTRLQCKRIHEAMIDILNAAIHHEGSTLADGTYRNAINGEGSYQNHHRVYDRKDQICPSCQKSRIRRIVQAQRSTFYCPRCQRA
jgi:formamidopyrimidine-DNA glycosylase